MDLQPRMQQKQITQLQPSNLQIVKENITQEDVESPVLPLAMTTSHTKKGEVLIFDEILKDDIESPEDIPSLNLITSPKEISPIADDLNQLDLHDNRSDFQIQELQQNHFKNVTPTLKVTHGIAICKHRSLSGAIRARRKSQTNCLSSKSYKKYFSDRKANTNTKRKSDRSALLGLKRAPSDLNLNTFNSPYIDLDLSSSHKRKRLNDDSFLKESCKAPFKLSNKDMIKAIESDEAMDYLRVRKQKGESKINIKKARIFDRVVLVKEEQNIQQQQLELDPFAQKQELISDNSSIMGDRWYDQKGVNFKFEVNSAVDSIEFPNNQNLNLKLNLKSLDGEQNQNQSNLKIDSVSPNGSKQPFQFTGQNVDLNLQIQNDNQILDEQEMAVKPDMKVLKIQKFTLSNIKPFDQLIDMESSENEDLQ